MKHILQAENLSKTFKGPEPLEILKGVSLELYEGKSLAIIGKSGSGKSSLLHILGTLDHPTSGNLSICGQDALSHPEKLRSQHIGFVFQSFHLLEESSLIENVLMPAKIARKTITPSSALYQRALDLLNFVGLLDKALLPAKFLSGGEKQRAAIARAFCNDPDLLLVDEPTGNLDPLNASLVQKLLLEGCKNHKKSLIVVTHDEEFASLCDDVLVLKDGRLEKR